MTTFGNQAVARFRSDRLADWKQLEKSKARGPGFYGEMLKATSDWGERGWAIAKTICEEYGSLWGDHITDEDARAKEIKRRQMIVARRIQRAAPTTQNGIEYGAPYSLDLHLAALRDDDPNYRPRAHKEWALVFAALLGTAWWTTNGG